MVIFYCDHGWWVLFAGQCWSLDPLRAIRLWVPLHKDNIGFKKPGIYLLLASSFLVRKVGCAFLSCKIGLFYLQVNAGHLGPCGQWEFDANRAFIYGSILTNWAHAGNTTHANGGFIYGSMLAIWAHAGNKNLMQIGRFIYRSMLTIWAQRAIWIRVNADHLGPAGNNEFSADRAFICPSMLASFGPCGMQIRAYIYHHLVFFTATICLLKNQTIFRACTLGKELTCF